jgi:mycothiol synthase
VVTLPADSGGIRWRHLRADDAPALLEVIRACEVADEQPYVTTLEEVEHSLADKRLDLARDSIGGFAADGSMVAFGAARPRSAAVQRRIVYQDGWVRPDFRRRGVGGTIIDFTEARSRQWLAEREAREGSDGVPAFLETYCDERLAGNRALYESRGFAPIRWYTDMRRDLAEPIPPVDLPAGLELAGWSSESDQEYREAHVTAFRDHWGSEPLTAEEWKQRFTGSPSFRPDLTVGVRDGGRLVGYVIGYHAPQDTEVTGRVEGWLGQIGTLREWRGRGVASALMAHVMQLMREAGMQDAMLDVDSENQSGAVGLYERLGFRPDRRSIRWAKSA